MIFNRPILLAAIIFNFLLVVNVSQALKEENNLPINPDAGKVNTQNEKFVNKKYANKEIVYGQDDDDDDDEDDASSSSASSSSTSNPIIPNQVHLNKDYSEFGSFEKSHNNNKNKLERQQRTDKHNKLYHDTSLDQLRSFHRESNVQRNMLKAQEDQFDFDYDQMLRKYFSAKSNKDKELNDLEALLGELVEDEEEQEDESYLNKNNRQHAKKVLAGAGNKLARKINKPVSNNFVDVKEVLMPEKEYNKQFIHNPNLFGDIDTNMPQAELVNSNNKAINSMSHQADQPAMALKQTNHHFDPNINSKIDLIKKQNDYLFIFIVGGCVLAGVVALVAAGVCWYTVHKSSKAIVLSEYGIKGGKVNSGSKLSLNSGDRRLAQSAQMYHYQHQKQQMIAMEKANNDTKPDNQSDSEGETEEGDYTVYECPGLAPTGEMEVKNPLFKEEFSSNNIGSLAANQPPAYSTLTTKPQEEQSAKVEPSPAATDAAAPKTTVTTVNESSADSKPTTENK